MDGSHDSSVIDWVAALRLACGEGTNDPVIVRYGDSAACACGLLESRYMQSDTNQWCDMMYHSLDNLVLTPSVS